MCRRQKRRSSLRILVARGLPASMIKRAKPYVLALAKQVPKHLDVTEAALKPTK